MNISKLTTFVIMAALCGLLSFAKSSPQADEPGVRLRAAMEKEEVDGDLQAAIGLYKKIVSDNGGIRAVAAQAQFRIGICHQKMGHKEAQSAFQKVIDNYPDQVDTVRLAQEQLSLLLKAQAVIEKKDQGPTIRQVWAGPGTDSYGSPSPDGKYLSFVDWSTSDLAVRDVETGKNRRLTDSGPGPGEYALSSIWSPDGKHLAYQWCNREGRPVELYVIGLDGSKPRILYSTKERDEWVEPYDWSPDGAQILATILRNKKRQMALVSAIDGSVRALKTLTQPARGVRFSPDGRLIVYDTLQAEDSVHHDIRMLSVAGDRDFPLVSHAADDSVLGWSPDGKFVLFLSDRTGSPCFWLLPVSNGKPNGSPQMIKSASRRTVPLGFIRDGRFFYAESAVASDVYLAKLDPQTGKIQGSPEKFISGYEGFNLSPRYSPDGKYLAYCSQRGQFGRNSNALCISSLETGIEREFLQQFRSLGAAGIARPHWSADNRSVLVNGEGRIYRLDVQTNDVILVVQGGDDFRVGPAISNDPKALLYQRRDNKSNLIQFVSRNTGSGREEIIHTFPQSANPLWPELSPDGRWLCYLDRPSGDRNRKAFYLMNPAGGEPRRIFEITGQEGLPNRFSWAADSKHILFTQKEAGVGWQLWRLPIDGGKPVLLGLAESSFIAHLSAHPDGQRIAFSRGPLSGAEIWVMENFLPK